MTCLGVTGFGVAGVVNGLSISSMAPTVAVGTADDLIGLLRFKVGGLGSLVLVRLGGMLMIGGSFDLDVRVLPEIKISV